MWCDCHWGNIPLTFNLTFVPSIHKWTMLFGVFLTSRIASYDHKQNYVYIIYAHKDPVDWTFFIIMCGCIECIYNMRLSTLNCNFQISVHRLIAINISFLTIWMLWDYRFHIYFLHNALWSYFYLVVLSFFTLYITDFDF